MKKNLVGASLLALGAVGALTTGAAQAADVGVSISIGEPGFYGRIDLGNVPRPSLIYAEPVIIERVRVRPAPIYLRVPPGHERHWSKHCHRYGACGQPVYFVRDDWYQRVYVPHHRDYYYEGRWYDRREGWRDGPRDRDRDGVPDYRDRDHGRGNDHGRGHGHGKGHDKHDKHDKHNRD